MTRRFLRGAVLLLVLVATAGGEENPFDETLRILERWTDSHWGRDCFVWIVHYPEELIGPWVEAEALKTGMTEAEKKAYREAFVSELKLDSAETFLVSVYSFGARPASLAPVAENIALVTASGERVRPTRYDSSLDSPAGGIVQGLVFFPKQRDRGFALAVRGLGVHEERVFSFSAPRFTEPLPSAELSGTEPKSDPDVVVVELPKRKATKVQQKPQTQAQQKSQRRTVEPAPETPPPPPAPRFIPPLFAEESKDMAAFTQSMRAERGQANGEGKKAREEPKKSQSQPALNADNAYVSRERVLRRFLGLWAENNAGEMYDMLSDGSKKVISRENFAKEVAKASDLRQALKGNFRIEWLGEERAKVVATQRLLMFRSVVSRTLGVVREASSWKIVW